MIPVSIGRGKDGDIQFTVQRWHKMHRGIVVSYYLCFSNIGEFDKLAKHLEAYGPAHHTEVNVSATTLYFAQVANLYNATALLFPFGTSGRQGLGLAQ